MTIDFTFGNWFIHVVTLSGVVSALYLLLRKMSLKASSRHLFLQFSFLMIPLLAILFQFQIEPRASGGMSLLEAKTPIALQFSEVKADIESSGESHSLNLVKYSNVALIALYFVFLIFGLLKIVYSYFSLLQIYKKSRPVVIEKTIVTYVHDEDLSPAAFGLFNPVILVPRRLIEELSEADLLMIVLHEKEHIKRLDPFFNVVRNFVEAVIFFSPLAKWLSRKCEEEMELSVDEALISADRVLKKDYGSLLVDLCSMDLRANTMACNGLSKNILERRILDMKKIEKLRSNKKVVLLAIGLVFSIGASVPVFGLSAKTGQALRSAKNGEGEQTIQLYPFVVNLSGDDTDKLLKIEMGFGTNNADAKREIEDRMMQVRDIVITLLSSKAIGDVSARSGKERIKNEIRDTLNSFLQKGKIENVYFSRFVHN